MGRNKNILIIALSLAVILSLFSARGWTYVAGRTHDFSLANPNGHCLNCHDTHQPKLQAGFSYALKRANEILVCYQCHAGTLNNYSSIDSELKNITSVRNNYYDIRSEFNRSNIHFPKYGMDGEINKCSECHNPHGVLNSHSTTKLPMLLSAGMNAVTGTYEYCLVCHNSDQNPPNPKFSNISVRSQFRFSRTVYKNMRHSTFERPTSSAYPHSYDTNPYGAGKDIPCLTCHWPHSAANAYLLRRPNDQSFCLFCHNQPAAGLRSFTSYHNGEYAPSLTCFTTSGHGKPSLNTYTYGRRIVCQDCHFPHGTGQKNAIYTTVSDPHTGRTSHDNIAVNGMNAVCFACHGSPSASGYYPRTSFYRSAIHKTSAQALNPSDTNGQAPGDCDNCHDPHGTFGNYSRMTVARRENLCYSCHNTATPNTADGKNVHAAFSMASHHDLTKVACKNCHNVHAVTQSSVMTNPFSPASTIADNKTFCLKCHSGAMPFGVTGAPNISVEWAGGGHDRNHVLTCSDCHVSHGSPNAKNLNYMTIRYGGYSATFGSRTALSFTKRAYCEACHNHRGTVGYKGASTIEAGAGRPDAHSAYDSTPCSNCHTKKHDPLLTSYTGASAYYSVYCLNCHKKGTGAAYENVSSDFNMPSHHALTYNPPTANDCTVCHGTHNNLSASNDVIDPNPGYLSGQSLNSTSYNAFCLKCHGTSAVSIGGQTPPNIIDTYTAAGHGMRSLTRNVLCTECHEHHGSPYKKLVKQTISGSAVSSTYSGINITTCNACHRLTDRNLQFWLGYSVYSGSIHSFGNSSTGNWVTDGQHGPGACDNCHNPHGVRSDGSLMPFMTYKKAENLCYRCHASGFDNFSTPGDYNNKWDHFGTVVTIAKQTDSQQTSSNHMAAHFGPAAITQNTAVWDGLVSSNAFPDQDAVITVKIRVPSYTYKAGQLTAGIRLEDAKTSSNTAPSSTNYMGVFYNMSAYNNNPIAAWRSSFNSTGTGARSASASAPPLSYTTLKIVRRKTFGTISSYAGTLSLGGRFTTSGYFRVRLYTYTKNNKNASSEALEAWFANFSVTYTKPGTTNLVHNTSSGDDVQARFALKTHHKISAADQADGSKVECTDCHDPHTITEKLMGYENTSSTSGKSVRAIVADQTFCLKCHSGSPPPGVVFPVLDSIVWNKADFTNSAHGNPLKRYSTLQEGQKTLNYNNGVYYPCKTCHNPHGSSQAHMQRDTWDLNRDGIPDDIDGDGILDSTNQVGYIGYTTAWNGTAWQPVTPRYAILVKTKGGIPSRAAFQRISSTIPPQADGTIDLMLCLNCHDGTPGPDVKSEFAKPYRHDVTLADQQADGNSKIDCNNCHDQHRAQARNDARKEYPTTNPTGNREPMPGDAPFCLKCHDVTTGTPAGVQNVSYGSKVLKNIKLSYNPNNYTDPVTGYDIITSSRQGHFVQSTLKAMNCRDCHNQHGSSFPKMLRDDTIPPNTQAHYTSTYYDSSQPIQNMRAVALRPSDPYGGGGTRLGSAAERCLSCHSGKTTYNGSLIPLPPPPNSALIGFTSVSDLPEVGKHPDLKAGLAVGNGLTAVNGHLYSGGSFAVSTSLGSVKDPCTTCHDSHKPYIATPNDELMDCYNCHNANTSLPDAQTEFDANPLNPTRSKSYHMIYYNPNSPAGVECRKCHDQAKHMQGRVRLRKSPSNAVSGATGRFIDYTSDALVWVSKHTHGGFISYTSLTFTNNSTTNRFCTECHNSTSAVASTFGGINPPKIPFNNLSGAHFANGKLACTDCHEYHGSVNTVLKRNTASDQELTFCYSCHTNKQNSAHQKDIQFQFMSTATHHQINITEQVANGSRVTCTNCHNPHTVSRTKPVVNVMSEVTAIPDTAQFCVGCHGNTGVCGKNLSPGFTTGAVRFPGYTTAYAAPEWDSSGKWNKWNKSSFISSPHCQPGSLNCNSCHEVHGNNNYRMLLTCITSALGSGRNITVGFGKHSTIRGKRTEELGVNYVCKSCHNNAMGVYTGFTVYPGYKSYSTLTFGRKSGIDKNCTYCHNPHGTSQTKFGSDTSALARMMRSNKPLYMNMTSKLYGSAYNYISRNGFNNPTTGSPYYAFCSSQGCHASEKAWYDSFNLNLPVDNYGKHATSSSHHPIKEGVIFCNSCHKEHGASTLTTDYLKPDLRATYYRASNWPNLWHSGIGVYSYNGSLITGAAAEALIRYQNGPHGRYYYSTGLYFNGANYFEWKPGTNTQNNYGNSPKVIAGDTGYVAPPANANDLCYMCHYKADIIGNYTTGMANANTRFLGHEAVAGGARMTHSEISPLNGQTNTEYHGYSCSACHLPHATSQNRLLHVGCFGQTDGQYSKTTNSNYGYGENAAIYSCHASTSYTYNGTTYKGWRNLTTSIGKRSLPLTRPSTPVSNLALTIDQTYTDQNLNVYLTWSAVPQSAGVKADHYNVYRSNQPITQDIKSSLTRIASNIGAGGANGNTGISATVSFTDKTGQPNTDYYYAVTACDSQNNESFISNCVAARLGPDTVPPNPVTTQTLVQPDGTYNVTLTWHDPGDNVNTKNYYIYKKIFANSTTALSRSDITFTNITSPAGYTAKIADTSQSVDGSGWPTDANTYTYTDTTPALGQYICYAVVAADARNMANGFKLYTPSSPRFGAYTTNITILSPAPKPVTTLTGVPVSRTMNEQLSWSAPANLGITDYYIYRKTSAFTNQTSLGGPTSHNYIGHTGSTATTYTDTVPAVNTNYYYAVTAVNGNATTAYKESLLGGSFGPVNIPAPIGFAAYSTTFNSGLGVKTGAWPFWSAPTNSTNLTNYKLYWRPSGFSAWSSVNANAPSSPKMGDNLIGNGGFETALNGWSPTGLTATIDTGVQHNGTSSVKLTTTSSADQNLSQSSYNSSYIQVFPSTSYTYSGWVYVPAAITGGSNVDGVTGPYTALRVKEYNGATLVADHENAATAVTSTSGWVYVSDTWTTGSTTNCVYLYLELQGVGTAWWDDMALTANPTTGTVYPASAKLDFTSLTPGSCDLCASAVYSSYAGVTNYESPVSGFATVSRSDTMAPAASPVSVTASGNNTTAVLSWNAPADNNVTGYNPSGVDHYVLAANYGSGFGTIVNSLLSNADFGSFSGTPDDGYSDTFTGWGASNTNMYAVSDSLFDTYAAKIVYAGSGDDFIYQAGPTGGSVANQTYSMSFWAKANKPTTFQYFIQESGGGFQWLGTQTPSIGTDWRRFTTSGTFGSGATATSARVIIRPSTDTSAAITIDGVRLCTGTEALNPDEGTFYQPSGYNVPNTAQTYTDNNLPLGGSATYKLWAVDAKGNYSAAGTTSTIYARPTAVTDLSATSSHTVTANVLGWSNQSTKVPGNLTFKVYARAQSSPITDVSTATQIGTVTQGAAASNIATQAAASSSTTYPGYSPGNVNDGNTSTYWYGNLTGPDSVALEWSTPQYVSRVSLNFYGFSSYYPKNFLIQTWSGSSWVTQYTVNGNSSQTPTYVLPAMVQTSAIQIYITDTVGGIASYYPIIGEIYVYGPDESFSHTPSNAYLPGQIGTPYAYAVIAEDANGVDSAISNSPTNAMADGDPPQAVSNLSATCPSGTTVNLSWTMPTDTNGDRATQFRVYRSPARTFGSYSAVTTSNCIKSSLVSQIGGMRPYSGTATPGVSTVTFTDYSTTDGIKAYYVVASGDSNNNWSAISNCPAPVTTRPTKITDLSAACSSSQTANVLNWSPSSSAAGLSKYYVYAKTQSTGLTSFTNTTCLTPGGLTPATTAGDLAPSATASSTTNYNSLWYPPSNAIDGSLTTSWLGNYSGPDSLVLTWASPVPVYKVSFYFSGNGWNSSYYPSNFLIQTWNGSSWVTQYTVTGNNSQTPTYYLPVPVSTTKLQIYITATVGGIGSYFPIITQMSVYGGESYTHAQSNAYLPAQANCTYAYAVQAVDVNNVGSAISNSPTQRVCDLYPPNAVTNLSATPVPGTSNVTLQWTMPDDPDAGKATQYRIYRLPATCPGTGVPITGSNYTSATLLYTGSYGSNQAGATITYPDTAACDGSTVYYAVTSGDSTGNWSSVSNSPYITTRPAAVTTLSAVESSTTSANVLTWSAPASTAGISRYIVYAKTRSTALTSFANATTIAPNLPPTQTTFTHYSSNTYLPARVGRYYAYAVQAVDVNNNSSAFGNSPTPYQLLDKDAPAAVTNLSASCPLGTSVNLSWTKPSDNVGATQYKIYRSPARTFGSYSAITANNYTKTSLVSQIGGTRSYGSPAFTDYSTADGIKAYYAVVSGDAAGNWSGISNCPPPVTTRPTKITSLSVTSSQTTSANILSWSPPVSRAGLALYRVYAKEQQTALTDLSGAFEIYSTTTNLNSAQTYTHSLQTSALPAQAGHAYAYAVTSLDVSGQISLISNSPVYTVQDRDPPLAVSDLAAVSPYMTDSAVLTWSTPYDNVGATKYVIYRLPASVLNDPTPVTDGNYASAFRVYSGTYASSTAGTQNNYIDSTWYNGYGAYYAVRSCDSAGNWSGVSNSQNTYVVIGRDTSSPTYPTNLRATPYSTSEIDISWTSSTDPDDGIAGYYLYRASAFANNSAFYKAGGITVSNVGSATMMTDIGPNMTMYQDTTAKNGLVSGTQYYYALQAYDTNGNVSALSTSVLAAAPLPVADTTPPTWQGSPLSVVAGAYPSIDLYWTPATDLNDSGGAGQIDHYNIRRSTQSSFATYSTIAKVAGISTYYIDNSGYTGNTYYYAVVAVDASQNHNASALSNIGSATVAARPCPDNVRPSLPGSFTASSGVYPYINLSWTPSADMDNCNKTQPLNYYKIYRANCTNCPFTITDANKNDITQVSTSIIANNAVDYAATGVGGNQYVFAIEAFDMAGNSSGLSNQVTAVVAQAPCQTTTPPTAPGGFTVTAGPSPSMDFSWSASSVSGCGTGPTPNVIDHYNLYYSTNQITTSTVLSSVPSIRISGNSTSYVDSHGSPNVTYWYVLTAVDSLGNESAGSTIASGTTATDTMPPATVDDLKAASSSGTVQLTWCKPSDNVGVDHYDIYRKAQGIILQDADVTPPSNNRIATFTNLGACLSYNDTTVTHGITYSYAVIAVDAAGNRSTISRGQLAGDTITTP